MTTTPLPDQQLADRIRHALNTAVSLPSCPPVTEHGRHRYELGCALCHGDLLVLTAAAVAVVQPELDRLAAENAELASELGARDEKARKRWIKNQEKQLGIRFANFRAGRWEMDLAMGREMAAAYVAMAKTMLGDAPNYTETKLEFDVKIAESPETYTLVVQRHAPGAVTPHEARQRAEAERDALAAELGRVRAELTTAREHLDALAPVKVWRNEDGREFLFADDVRGALGVVHACPPGNSALTPCCGKTPFELARTDRLTYDQAEITCPAAAVPSA